MKFGSEKGVSLYYAILIMSLTLAAALGLNTIAIKSIKITREVEKSPPALYAADTGIERALYEVGITTNWGLGETHTITLDEMSATIDLQDKGQGKCPDDCMYCIQSVGSYRKTSRALRIVR